MKTLRRFSITCLGLLAALSSLGTARAEPEAITITNVTVLPMTREGTVLRNATVLIRGDRIAAIGSGKKIEAVGRSIDGRGKWLMPALADMHTHIENDRMARLYLRDPSIVDGTVKTADALLPYVANGVLQIAVLSAMSETLEQRKEVESGKVLGPHMALAAMIDGSPPLLPPGIARVAVSPEAGREAVREAAAEGYDLIKVYSRLDLNTFLAVVDEARTRGLRVIGHIPQREQGITEKFFVPGFGMVAHAEEFAMQTAPPAIDQIGKYAQLAKRNGTWLATTLTLDERILEMTAKPESLQTRPEIRYLGPQLQAMVVHHNPYVQHASPDRIAYLQRVVDFNRALVRTFAEQGVPIVAATDALNPGIVAGFSLHDELEALAEAGLSNRAVLEAATRAPAEWLGTIEDRGEVVVGKRADLLLLDADPLEDVSNTRRIAAVIASGRYYSRAELDERMADLKERHSVK